MKPWILVVTLVGLLVLAGCQPAQPTASTTPAAQTAAPTAAPQATTAAAPTAAPQATTAAAPTAAQSVSGGLIPVTPQATLPPVKFKVQGDGTAVAMVNGVAIKLSEYERTANQVRNSFIEEGLDPNTPEGKLQLAQVYDEILETLVAQELVRQGAKAEGVTVVEDDIKKEMDRITTQQGGEQKLQEVLTAQNLTRDDLINLVRDRLLANKLAETLTRDLKTTGEQVQVRHILVKTEEEAKKVIERIKAGEDFGAVAREVSTDPGGKTNGGDLGWLSRGQTVAPFEQAAFSLAIKTLSEPVQSQFGYHVIEVLAKDANRQLPQEQVEQLREEKLVTWLDNQRKAAKIEELLIKE